MLFLPQFVVVVAFPAMSNEESRGRTVLLSVSMVAAVGAVAVVGSWLFSGVAMIFVGGSKYSDIEPLLWLFACLGTVLAILQLLVYAVLARQGRRSIYATWVAVVAVVGLGAIADSVGQLLITVVCVDTVLLISLLIITAHRSRELSRQSTVP